VTHPTATLIAGGVLLFGAAGLANLYLPKPAAVIELTKASEVTAPQVAAFPKRSPALAVSRPIQPPVANTLPMVFSATDRAVQSATSDPLKSLPVKAAGPPATVNSKSTTTRTTSSLLADSTQRPLAPQRPNTVPTAAVPATAPPLDADQYALSATLGDRAWIRVGDHRTIMAKVGDSIPGLGKVTAVGTNILTLQNGQTLKVTP